jgi:hypothetical protein
MDRIELQQRGIFCSILCKLGQRMEITAVAIRLKVTTPMLKMRQTTTDYSIAELSNQAKKERK